MNEKPLSELDAHISQLDDEGGGSRGVWFTCPSCAHQRHSIYVPWSGKSPYLSGAIWQLQSEPQLDVLTLSPSVNCDVTPTYHAGMSSEERALQEQSRCRFHGWVQGGKVRW